MRTEVGEHQIGCLIGQGKGFGFYSGQEGSFGE